MLYVTQVDSVESDLAVLNQVSLEKLLTQQLNMDPNSQSYRVIEPQSAVSSGSERVFKRTLSVAVLQCCSVC